MSIAHLVRRQDGRGWLWSDTNKSARIKRDIEEKTFDLTAVDPSWKQNPSGLAAVRVPYRGSLPRDTEVTFYIVEQDLNGERPYLKVKYVEARR